MFMQPRNDGSILNHRVVQNRRKRQRSPHRDRKRKRRKRMECGFVDRWWWSHRWKERDDRMLTDSSRTLDRHCDQLLALLLIDLADNTLPCRRTPFDQKAIEVPLDAVSAL
jgi:hypothetical protein